MSGHGSAVIRTTHNVNGDENLLPRTDGKIENAKVENKPMVSRLFAPIDSNQQQESPAISATKPNTKLQNPSRSQSTEDPNAIVTIEEVRKSQDGSVTIHRYLRGKLLGKGGFAKVYMCTSIDTNKVYAVKIVPKANLVKARARQKLQAEIKIHRTLKHRNICEFKHFFEDRINCYILLELCELQSMNELLRRRKRLTEPEVMFFMFQLIQGTVYMHANNVIHRDLKLGNLFLSRSLEVKIGDLGLATKLDTAEDRRTTICGTPNYIAPEIIDGKKGGNGHSFEVDIWSIGVILYTLIFGRPPYESKDVKATYQRILNNEYSFPENITVSESAKDLIRAMLQKEPTSRPTLIEVGKHRFFANSDKIPKTLPYACAFVEPTWSKTADGAFILTIEDETAHSTKSKKLTESILPSPSISEVIHQPVLKEKIPSSSMVERQLPSKVSLLSGIKSSNPFADPFRRKNGAFQVYDENNQQKMSNQRSDESATFGVDVPHSLSNANKEKEMIQGSIVEITTKTSALKISEGYNFGHSGTVSNASSNTEKLQLPTIPSADTLALEMMHTRLSAFLEHAVEVDVVSECEATISVWVTRYVDYTSKYGLGFLFNNRSAGVYFNDSTKAVVGPDGEIFHYIERRRNSFAGQTKTLNYEVHSFTSYPESLKKKVTLLKHFYGYLLEQQNRVCVEETQNDLICDTCELIYLTKWVRTRHAIFFRLSDGTVQIIFFDQTEIILSSDISKLVYVDKSQNRTSMLLELEILTSHPDIAKRLKYARDILCQLVQGGKS